MSMINGPRRTLPSFECYVPYSSGNYGINALVFTAGDFTVWYSYKTPVAFWSPQTGKVIRENEWGPTTGKHLNAIDSDKSKRIRGTEFEKLLLATLF